jgi:hypothetical protein
MPRLSVRRSLPCATVVAGAFMSAAAVAQRAFLICPLQCGSFALSMPDGERQ